MEEKRFPHVYVKLIGEDGNAYAILSRVRAALREGGATSEQVKEFFVEATRLGYEHLLLTVDDWVDVAFNSGILAPDEDASEQAAKEDAEDLLRQS